MIDSNLAVLLAERNLKITKVLFYAVSIVTIMIPSQRIWYF